MKIVPGKMAEAMKLMKDWNAAIARLGMNPKNMRMYRRVTGRGDTMNTLIGEYEWDSFTEMVLALANGPIFPNFIGTFDPSGKATAQIVAPPFPGYAGLGMQFAYTKYNPFGYVSNPVSIDIV